MLIPDINHILERPGKYRDDLLARDFPDFYNYIKTFGLPTREALYVYYFGVGICAECHKKTKFISLRQGYQKFCSETCSARSKETRAKFVATSRKRYGTDHPFQNKEIHNKHKASVYEKYGVEYTGSIPSKIEKTKKTLVKKYGGVGFASSEIKSKIDQTKLLKYGDENYSNRPAALKTHIERYGGIGMASPEIRSKIESTNVAKYDTKYPISLKYIRDKAKQTLINRYGGIGNASIEIQKRVEKTCQARYGGVGVASPELYEKFKEKCIERHETEYVMKNKSIQERALQTFRHKFIENNTHGVVGYSEDHQWLIECDDQTCKFYQECDRVFKITPDIYWSRKNLGTTLCTKIQPVGSNESTGERELYEFISSIYSGATTRGWNGLYFDTNQPKQIDVYLSELKIGFEFNGIYYHNLGAKTRDYHFKKWKAANEMGIRLITIWDFQWSEDREGVKSFIKKVLDGDRDAKYGNRVDGMSYNEWVDVNLNNIVLEEQRYNEFSYCDCGVVV